MRPLQNEPWAAGHGPSEEVARVGGAGKALGKAAFHKGWKSSAGLAISRLVGMTRATCKVMLLQEQVGNTLKKLTARQKVLLCVAGKPGLSHVLGERRKAECKILKANETRW